MHSDAFQALWQNAKSGSNARRKVPESCIWNIFPSNFCLKELLCFTLSLKYFFAVHYFSNCTLPVESKQGLYSYICLLFATDVKKRVVFRGHIGDYSRRCSVNKCRWGVFFFFGNEMTRAEQATFEKNPVWVALKTIGVNVQGKSIQNPKCS